MRIKTFGLIVCWIALALVCGQASAFDGLVTGVHDGDSLTVLNEQGLDEKIRLRRADTPERRAFTWGYQPYAAEARTSLLNLCAGKIASVIRHGKDRNGRTLGDVSCQGFDVARWQIESGAAWAYRYSSTIATRAWQANAKGKGLGLWALPNPIEPWAWRKNALH